MKAKTVKKSKISISDKEIDITLNALNKMIDNLTIKKNIDEEAAVKCIYHHLGFTIGYIDGEKELTSINNELKKNLKGYIKAEDLAFAKATAIAKKAGIKKKTSKKAKS